MLFKPTSQESNQAIPEMHLKGNKKRGSDSRQAGWEGLTEAGTAAWWRGVELGLSLVVEGRLPLSLELSVAPGSWRQHLPKGATAGKAICIRILPHPLSALLHYQGVGLGGDLEQRGNSLYFMDTLRLLSEPHLLLYDARCNGYSAEEGI